MLYAGLRAGCGYVLYCCYLHSTALIGAMDVILLLDVNTNISHGHGQCVTLIAWGVFARQILIKVQPPVDMKSNV